MPARRMHPCVRRTERDDGRAAGGQGAGVDGVRRSLCVRAEAAIEEREERLAGLRFWNLEQHTKVHSSTPGATREYEVPSPDTHRQSDTRTQPLILVEPFSN